MLSKQAKSQLLFFKNSSPRVCIDRLKAIWGCNFTALYQLWSYCVMNE